MTGATSAGLGPVTSAACCSCSRPFSFKIFSVSSMVPAPDTAGPRPSMTLAGGEAGGGVAFRVAKTSSWLEAAGASMVGRGAWRCESRESVLVYHRLYPCTHPTQRIRPSYPHPTPSMHSNLLTYLGGRGQRRRGRCAHCASCWRWVSPSVLNEGEGM